jgi:hypothetical protein
MSLTEERNRPSTIQEITDPNLEETDYHKSSILN